MSFKENSNGFAGRERSKGQLVTRTALAGVLGVMLAGGASSAMAAEDEAPTREEMWEMIQKQQRQIEALREERAAGDSADVEALEERLRQTERKLEAAASAIDRQAKTGGEGWWDRVALGGYGSVRFEASNADGQNTGFTYRRFVLALDAQPTDRLQTYLELELERFAELEIEKEVAAGPGEFEVAQAVEGTSASELAVEQAWARYSLSPSFNIDAGALLVPLGRFNINHDDNAWNLPRRSLVDRGAPVLPAGAAWPELGAGVSGNVSLGSGGLLDFRAYAVNGATVDFEMEEVLVAVQEGPDEVELESKLEAEFGPSQGAFNENSNDNLSLTGRLALQPSPGHEIAVSGYVGNYVPEFLGESETLWSVGIDGMHRIGGFEVEYEGIRTRFNNVSDVAQAFADRALTKERGIEGPLEDGTFAKHEIEFTLSSYAMAETKTGYWVELRRPFWPDALNDTVLGRGFENPQLVPTFRMEQVFYDGQITGIEFSNGTVTELSQRDAKVNRATLGLGYRPTPNWVVQIAGEYAWTDEPTLTGLTNYLDAGERDDAFSVLAGVAFGF